MPRKRKEIVQLINEASSRQLPVLDLSKCNSGDLLKEICRMTWLAELNLSHCHIALLPDDIGNLINLERLDLSENQLAGLPESITDLTALKHLNLTLAGYEFKLSGPQEKWIEQIPELVWENRPPPEPPPIVLSDSDHPNLLLTRISQAMKLYSDAFNMEERGYGGDEKRIEADEEIDRIFEQFYEMKELLPEFYRDFKEHAFYWSNRESEKTIDNNPFRLPTVADDEWLAKFAAGSEEELPPPLGLTDEISDSSRTIFAAGMSTGQRSKIFSCEYGSILVSNQPYAEDELYFADCTAKLLQAGLRRFFVRAETDGQGGGLSLKWFGSDDRGASWQPQPRLTFDWLEKNHRRWRELSVLHRSEEL